MSCQLEKQQTNGFKSGLDLDRSKSILKNSELIRGLKQRPDDSFVSSNQVQ